MINYYQLISPSLEFEQITLDQILLSGCAIVFGTCILVQHAQAAGVCAAAHAAAAARFQSVQSL